MDHVWDDLVKWESIWEEHLQEEKDRADHEYKEHNMELLKGQLASIRKAKKEIGKWV